MVMGLFLMSLYVKKCLKWEHEILANAALQRTHVPPNI